MQLCQLHAPQYGAVHGVGEQKIGDRCIVLAGAQIAHQGLHLFGHAQRQFEFGAFLLRTLAKPWFQFFLGHVPKACPSLLSREVDRRCPGKVVFDQLAHAPQAHRAIERERCLFVGVHVISQGIDQIGVGLHQQRNQLFLALKAEMFMRPTIQPIPGLPASQGAAFDMFGQQREIGAQRFNLADLQKMFSAPLGGVALCIGERGAEDVYGLRRRLLDRAHARQRLFSCRHPAVQQSGVVDDEWRHAQTG